MHKFLIFTFLISFSASAEYRVYQYIVKNKVANSSDQPNSHIIESTLDPVSYGAYNGGNSLVQVDLLRTWICPGYTGGKKSICESPYGKIPLEVLQ